MLLRIILYSLPTVYIYVCFKFKAYLNFSYQLVFSVLINSFQSWFEVWFFVATVLKATVKASYVYLWSLDQILKKIKYASTNFFAELCCPLICFCFSSPLPPYPSSSLTLSSSSSSSLLLLLLLLRFFVFFFLSSSSSSFSSPPCLPLSQEAVIQVVIECSVGSIEGGQLIR